MRCDNVPFFSPVGAPSGPTPVLKFVAGPLYPVKEIKTGNNFVLCFEFSDHWRLATSLTGNSVRGKHRTGWITNYHPLHSPPWKLYCSNARVIATRYLSSLNRKDVFKGKM